MTTSASLPLVHQSLVPLRTKESPSSLARQETAAASEPAPDSESEKAPSFFPDARGTRYFFFCSSVPNFRMGSQTRELLTDMITPVEAQARLISSMASTYST